MNSDAMFHQKVLLLGMGEKNKGGSLRLAYRTLFPYLMSLETQGTHLTVITKFSRAIATDIS